jgi:hypothetical protein
MMRRSALTGGVLASAVIALGLLAIGVSGAVGRHAATPSFELPQRFPLATPRHGNVTLTRLVFDVRPASGTPPSGLVAHVLLSHRQPYAAALVVTSAARSTSASSLYHYDAFLALINRNGETQPATANPIAIHLLLDGVAASQVKVSRPVFTSVPNALGAGAAPAFCKAIAAVTRAPTAVGFIDANSADRPATDTTKRSLAQATANLCNGRKAQVNAANAILATLGPTPAPPPTPSPSGSWSFTSSDHKSITIDWKTDNGQNASYEVFTLTQPIASADCGADGNATIGQPDGSPNQFECHGTPEGEAHATTTQPMGCNDQIQNKDSFNGTSYVAQANITAAANNCPAAPPGPPPPPALSAPTTTVGCAPASLMTAFAQFDKQMAAVAQHILAGTLSGEALVNAIDTLYRDKIRVIAQFGQSLFGLPAHQVIVRFDSIDIALERARASAALGGHHGTAVAGGNVEGAIHIKQKLEAALEAAGAPEKVLSAFRQFDKQMAAVEQHVLAGTLSGEALVAAINKLVTDKNRLIGGNFDVTAGQNLYGVPAYHVIVGFDSIDIALERARASAALGGHHGTAVAGGYVEGAIHIKQKLEASFTPCS